MNSVNSVGDTTHPDNLCKSVKSVGEHLSRMKSVGFFLHHTSVNSVNSVGDTTHPDNLCKSVKSVGEHLSRVKSVGEHLSRVFLCFSTKSPQILLSFVLLSPF